MIYRTTIHRTHRGEVSDTDYEVEVNVEYVLHPATTLEDASVEVLGAADDDGHEWTLTTQEELRVMRMVESYRDNPVRSVRA